MERLGLFPCSGPFYTRLKGQRGRRRKKKSLGSPCTGRAIVPCRSVTSRSLPWAESHGEEKGEVRPEIKLVWVGGRRESMQGGIGDHVTCPRDSESLADASGEQSAQPQL